MYISSITWWYVFSSYSWTLKYGEAWILARTNEFKFIVFSLPWIGKTLLGGITTNKISLLVHIYANIIYSAVTIDTTQILWNTLFVSASGQMFHNLVVNSCRRPKYKYNNVLCLNFSMFVWYVDKLITMPDVQYKSALCWPKVSQGRHHLKTCPTFGQTTSVRQIGTEVICLPTNSEYFEFTASFELTCCNWLLMKQVQSRTFAGFKWRQCYQSDQFLCRPRV